MDKSESKMDEIAVFFGMEIIVGGLGLILSLMIGNIDLAKLLLLTLISFNMGVIAYGVYKNQ